VKRETWEGRAATLNRALETAWGCMYALRAHGGTGSRTGGRQRTITHGALDMTGVGECFGQSAGGAVDLDGCVDGGQGNQGDNWTNVALPPPSCLCLNEPYRHDLGVHVLCVWAGRSVDQPAIGVCVGAPTVPHITSRARV
jgi:hypothetical protein